jgi:hypothetical protein
MENNPQPQSLFFSLLPAEIRLQIYIDCWRLSGLRHQMYSACIAKRHHKLHTHTDLYMSDWPMRPSLECQIEWIGKKRFMRLQEPGQRELQALVHDDGPACKWQPFLPVLRTCRRMYGEAYPTIWENLTFVLYGPQAVQTFLEPAGRMQLVRRLELNLVFNLDGSLGQLLRQLRASDTEAEVYNARQLDWDLKWNVWVDLFETLAVVPRLERLVMFCRKTWVPENVTGLLDPKWLCQIPERIVFETLWKVRRPRQFVLCVPGLLEEDELKEWPWFLTEKEVREAPFQLLREPIAGEQEKLLLRIYGSE